MLFFILFQPELIERHGFPAEIHHVTTADGYVLTVHRIPCGKKNIPLGRNREAEARPVVFLQHGMFGTSADWIINAEQKSLGEFTEANVPTILSSELLANEGELNVFIFS